MIQAEVTQLSAPCPHWLLSCSPGAARWPPHIRHDFQTRRQLPSEVSLPEGSQRALPHVPLAEASVAVEPRPLHELGPIFGAVRSGCPPTQYRHSGRADRITTRYSTTSDQSTQERRVEGAGGTKTMALETSKQGRSWAEREVARRLRTDSTSRSDPVAGTAGTDRFPVPSELVGKP